MHRLRLISALGRKWSHIIIKTTREQTKRHWTKGLEVTPTQTPIPLRNPFYLQHILCYLLGKLQSNLRAVASTAFLSLSLIIAATYTQLYNFLNM